MMIKNLSSGMNIKIIITSKNVIDLITIELLRKIAESKKNNIEAISLKSTKTSTSASKEVIMSLPPITSKEINKVTSLTSSLEVSKVLTVPISNNDVRALILSSFTIMVPHLLPSTNMTSFSSSTNNEVLTQSKINYFANLLTYSNESDNELDSYTIPYPSIFVVNEFLLHSRSLAHLDSSTKILKRQDK
jgi:hypothetical protein